MKNSRLSWLSPKGIICGAGVGTAVGVSSGAGVGLRVGVAILLAFSLASRRKE